MERLQRDNLAIDLFHNVFKDDKMFIKKIRVYLLFKDIYNIYSKLSKSKRKYILRYNLIDDSVKLMLRKISRMGDNFSITTFLTNHVSEEYVDVFIKNLISLKSYISNNGNYNPYWYKFLDRKVHKNIYYLEFYDFYNLILMFLDDFKHNRIKLSGYDIEKYLFNCGISNVAVSEIIKSIGSKVKSEGGGNIHKIVRGVIQENELELIFLTKHETLHTTISEMEKARNILTESITPDLMLDSEYVQTISIIAKSVIGLLLNLLKSCLSNDKPYSYIIRILDTLDFVYKDYKLGYFLKKVLMYTDFEIAIGSDSFVFNLLFVLDLIKNLNSYELSNLMYDLVDLFKLTG